MIRKYCQTAARDLHSAASKCLRRVGEVVRFPLHRVELRVPNVSSFGSIPYAANCPSVAEISNDLLRGALAKQAKNGLRHPYEKHKHMREILKELNWICCNSVDPVQRLGPAAKFGPAAIS